MFNPNGAPVKRAQFHVGYGNLSRTGCDTVKDSAEMELTPAGVYIKRKEGTWIVPYSNTVWVELAEKAGE